MSPLKNLSVTGTRFIGEYGFAVGSVLELHLHLPTSERLVALKGVVVWQRRLGPGPMAEHGVTFSTVEPFAHQQIAKAIEFFSQKSQRAHG